MDGKKNKKAIIDKKINEITDVWSGDCEQIVTDVSGSYTGTPEVGVVPTQDADDL